MARRQTLPADCGAFTECAGQIWRERPRDVEFQTSLRKSCRSATPVCQVNLSTPDLGSVSTASTPSVAYHPVAGMKVGTSGSAERRFRLLPRIALGHS